jgi:hypothetical protein
MVEGADFDFSIVYACIETRLPEDCRPIGATGLLGTRVCERLRTEGNPLERLFAESIARQWAGISC